MSVDVDIDVDINHQKYINDPRVILYTGLVRGAFEHDVRMNFNELITKYSDQALIDAAVIAFHTRDVRGGKGERQLFYSMMCEFFTIEPELAISLFELIPDYGSWDDMFTMAAQYPALKEILLAVAAKQLVEDEKNIMLGRPISLVGKWAPREDKHFKGIAKDFAYMLVGSQRITAKHSQIMAAYRKRLARLNVALQTVEVYECANRWDEINPIQVPSRALTIKLRAYLNEKVTNSNVLRKPNDEKRNSCREHFQTFFNTHVKNISLNQNTEELSIILNDKRYEPVRARVVQWIYGGWRYI